MNKTFKRFMSVILCALLLFTTASVAFAVEEVFEKSYTCYFYYSMDFIVVTFNSKYSQIGKKTEVQLCNGSDTLSITEDEITLKIFEYESKRYPQLFINTKADIDEITGIEISEGAFVTESGEISGKVNIQKDKIIQRGDFGVSCKIEAFEVDERIDLKTSKTCYYTTVGKPVEIVGYGDYGKVWFSEITATCTVNERTVEINSNEFVPQEPGKYVVELKFDDIVTKKLEINVLSENDAYSKNLSNTIDWRTPLYALFGTVMLLVPGFGMVIGAFMLESVKILTSRFFTALFDGPVYEEYVIR